jgi:hypothetical protein
MGECLFPQTVAFENWKPFDSQAVVSVEEFFLNQSWGIFRQYFIKYSFCSFLFLFFFWNSHYEYFDRLDQSCPIASNMLFIFFIIFFIVTQAG